MIIRSGLEHDVITALSESPAVAILGARQVGKTTLARQVAERWGGPVGLFDLERPTIRAALQQTPESILERLHDRRRDERRAGERSPLDRRRDEVQQDLIVIDEIQRMPELFEILRPLCDAPNRAAAFLLLGSASWSLIRGVSESLAGRVQFVQVSGFSLDETDFEQQNALWLRGGFPRAFLAKTDEARERWMSSFFQTFIERDIPSFSKVSPEAVGRFWRMLANYHGQVWNASAIAASMDTSPRSANHYRDLLAGTFMIRVLPPWFENIGKRLVKSPKIYLRDSGMLHYLLGIDSLFQLQTHPRYGASWEGFALEQTLLVHGERDAYFYATQGGAELDLLLVRRGRKFGFEFKCTESPSVTRSMNIALQDLKLEHLYVVYPGTLRYPLAEKVSVLPLREMRNAMRM